MPLTQRSRLRATSLRGSRDADGAFVKDGEAAQLLDGELEGHAGAQRRLLEEQRDGFAGQRGAVVLGRALDFGGEIEEGEKLVRG